MQTNRIGFETDLDKCIEVLAQAKCDIDSGTASPETIQYYNIEYQKLIPVDRLKVMQIARSKQQALRLCYHVKPIMFHDKLRELIKILSLFFCISLAVVLFLLFGIGYTGCSLSGSPNDYAYPKVKGSDINGDGKINCIDYAISYKLIWDQANSASAYKCEIVRNKNPHTGMHHLFIRIRNFYTYEWEYIEPQNGIRMDLFWGDKYNPAYNIFGETDWWLSKRK